MERSARAELSQDAGLQALAARQSVGWKSRIGRPVNGSPLPDFRPDFRDAAAVVPVSADAAGVLNSPPQRSTEGAVTGKPAVRWPLRAGGGGKKGPWWRRAGGWAAPAPAGPPRGPPAP